MFEAFWKKAFEVFCQSESLFESSLQSKSDIIQHKKWHQIETPFEISTTHFEVICHPVIGNLSSICESGPRGHVFQGRYKAVVVNAGNFKFTGSVTGVAISFPSR